MTTTITGATGVNQITDDAITAAKMPSGSILQTKVLMPNTGRVVLATPTWTEVKNTFRLSFTPLLATSTLLIECSFLFGGSATNIISHFKIYDITNSSDIELSNDGSRTGVHGAARQVDHDNNDCDMMYIQVVTAATNTSARTYGLFSKNESGTENKDFFSTPTNSTGIGYAKPVFKVTEIAA